MKLKSLLFVCGLGLMSSLFAGNRHIHPDADAGKSAAAGVTDKAMLPGYCEIEVINSSYQNVSVYGTFEDNSQMMPFDVYSGDYPHYISLFYKDWWDGHVPDY